MGNPPPNWPDFAKALAAQIPATRLHPSAWNLLAANKITGRIAVAFSGGADSLALLLLLHTHLPQALRRRLLALHFDHRLRGRASTGDARFCQKICAALGVECIVGRWENRPRPARGISEAIAREARHAFFSAQLRHRRSRLLCLGHHKDDVAEQLLMGLARGSGTAGLSGPRPAQALQADRRTHLRPLLTLSRHEIETALRQLGIPWRDDHSNATDAYFRNRIRRHVLPALIAAAPERDILAGMTLSRERLEEDEHALESWAENAIKTDSEGRLILPPLRAELPRAVWRRILWRWIRQNGGGQHLSRTGFERILALVESGRPGRVSFDSTHLIVVKKHRLGFQKAPPQTAGKASPAN